MLKLSKKYVFHYSTSHPSRKFIIGLLILTLSVINSIVLTGCAFPGSTKPVIKIGLISPFEGEYRHSGYQRLYGVKLALAEMNLTGGVAGYKIELVALNDYNDPTETGLQAYELVLDPDVRAVIGPWDENLYHRASQVYGEANMPVVDPTQFTEVEKLSASFEADYQRLAGAAPGPEAKQAYLATQYLIDLVDLTVREAGSPERRSLLETLEDDPAKNFN